MHGSKKCLNSKSMGELDGRTVWSWGTYSSGENPERNALFGSFRPNGVQRKLEADKLEKDNGLLLFQTIREHDFGFSPDKEPYVPNERLLPPPEEEIYLRAVTSVTERVRALEDELLDALSASDRQIGRIWAPIRELTLFVSKRPMSDELHAAIPEVLKTIIDLWQLNDLPVDIPPPCQAIAVLKEHGLMTKTFWHECFRAMVPFTARAYLLPHTDQAITQKVSPDLSLAQLLSLWRLYLAGNDSMDETWFHRKRDFGSEPLWEILPWFFARRHQHPGRKGSLAERFLLFLPSSGNTSVSDQEMGDHFLTTLAIMCLPVQSGYIDIGGNLISDVGPGDPGISLTSDERSFMILAAMVAIGSPTRSPLKHTDLNIYNLPVDVTTRMARYISGFVSRASDILPSLIDDVFVPSIHDEAFPVREFLSREPHYAQMNSYLGNVYREESVRTRLENNVPSAQVEWAIRETSRNIPNPLENRVPAIYGFYFFNQQYAKAMLVWRAFNRVLRYNTDFWKTTLKKLRQLQSIDFHEQAWVEMERCQLKTSHKLYHDRLSFLVRNGEVDKAAQAFILLLRRAENAKSLLVESGKINGVQARDLSNVQDTPLTRNFLFLLMTEGEDQAAFELFRLLQGSTQIRFSPGASLLYLLLDCALKNGLSDEANVFTQELRALGIRLREEQAAAIFAADMLSWKEDTSVPTIKQRLSQALALVFPNATWPSLEVEGLQTMGAPERLMRHLTRAYVTFVNHIVGYCDSKFDTTKFVLAVYDHALTVTGVMYSHDLYTHIQQIFSDQLRQAPRLGIMLARDRMLGVSRRRDKGVDYLLSFYLSGHDDRKVQELRHYLEKSEYGRQLIQELAGKKPEYHPSETRIWDLMPMSMGMKDSKRAYEEDSRSDDLANIQQFEDLAREDQERAANEAGLASQNLSEALGDHENLTEPSFMQEDSNEGRLNRLHGTFDSLGINDSFPARHFDDRDVHKPARFEERAKDPRGEQRSDPFQQVLSGMRDLLAVAKSPQIRRGSREESLKRHLERKSFSAGQDSQDQLLRDHSHNAPQKTQSPPPILSNPRVRRTTYRDSKEWRPKLLTDNTSGSQARTMRNGRVDERHNTQTHTDSDKSVASIQGPEERSGNQPIDQPFNPENASIETGGEDQNPPFESEKASAGGAGG